MPLQPVPATRTKLAISYSIFVTAQNGARHKIGTFRNLNTREGRRVENQFTLDADLSGQPFEAIPQIATDKVLNYDALTLYSQNLLELLADKGRRIESLADFNIPFDVEMQITSPDGTIKTKKYVNCWLTDYTETVEIRNLIVSATGSITYERIDYPLT